MRGRIAGGCAGAASRTVVSPLERLKIIQSDATTFILAVSLETKRFFYFFADKYNHGDLNRNIRVFGGVCRECGRRRALKDL